jgi:hypothetical protein
VRRVRAIVAVLALTVLASCAMIFPQDPPVGVPDPTAVLTVTPAVSAPELGPLYDVAFRAGPAAAENVILDVDATDNATLRVNDKKCAYRLDTGKNLGLRCKLGTIPAGGGYRITVRAGDLPKAIAYFTRPGIPQPRSTTPQ